MDGTVSLMMHAQERISVGLYHDEVKMYYVTVMSTYVIPNLSRGSGILTGRVCSIVLLVQ